MNYTDIGMRAHDLPANTPADLRDCAKKHGIDYVQLALRKSFNTIDWTNHTFSVGLAEKIKRDLGDLRISVLGSYIDLAAEGEAWEGAKAVFCQNMLFAKYLNAGVVGTETGVRRHEGTEEEYNRVVKNTRELADVAEKLGVMIGIEGVEAHPIKTPEMMRRFLDDVNSPNVLTILDPINYLCDDNWENQDEILIKSFELLSDKLTAIHLKDFDVIDGKFRNVQIGTGKFNYKLLMECVAKYKTGIDMLLEGSNADLCKDAVKYILSFAE